MEKPEDSQAGNDEQTVSNSVQDQLEELKSLGGDYDPDSDEGLHDSTDAHPEVEVMSDADLANFLGETIHMGTTALAEVRGPHWERPKPMCVQFATCFVKVMNKYFPSVRTGPEAALLMSAFTLLGPPLATEALASRVQVVDSGDQSKSEDQ